MENLKSQGAILLLPLSAEPILLSTETTFVAEAPKVQCHISSTFSLALLDL